MPTLPTQFRVVEAPDETSTDWDYSHVQNSIPMHFDQTHPQPILLPFCESIGSNDKDVVACINPEFRRDSGYSSNAVTHVQLIMRCEELCGLSLYPIDLQTGYVHCVPDGVPLRQVTRGFISLLREHQIALEFDHRLGAWRYGICLPRYEIYATGLFYERPGPVADHQCDLSMFGCSSNRLPRKWLNQHTGIRPEHAERLLKSAAMILEQEFKLAMSDLTGSSVTQELSTVYESISLINDLPKYTIPGADPFTVARSILTRVMEICDVERWAYCLKHPVKTGTISSESWGISTEDINSLVQGILKNGRSRAIVRNQFEKSLMANGFPGLKAIAAVPLLEDDQCSSWILIANPRTNRNLGSEDVSLLKTVSYNLAMHLNHLESVYQRDEMEMAFIRSLVSTIDARDSYTRGHSERVARVARILALQMKLDTDEVTAVYKSGLLHDIGKIGIDDSILRKSGALNEAEFAHMSRHPEIGYRILEELPSMQHLLDGVLYHHERYDGKGYPHKLCGCRIPLMARILAVADSFDAMRSDRPYRKGMVVSEVEQVLKAGTGTQWDPAVIHAFFVCKDEIYKCWSGHAASL